MASLWAFRFVLWYICIFIVQPQVRFPFLYGLQIADISVAMALGLHVMSAGSEGRPIIRWGAASRLAVAMVLFGFISMYIGAFQTSHRWGAHGQMLWKGALIMMLLDAMAFNIQRVWAVMATIGISTLWWMKAGFRLASAGETFRGERLLGPATGLTDDPNAFAYLVCLMIPLYIYLGKYTTAKWVGYLYKAMVFLAVFIIFETGSRSGFVALIVLAIFLAVHYWRTQKQLIVISVVAVPLVLQAVDPTNLERITSIGKSVQSFVYGETEEEGEVDQDEHSALARRKKNKDTWELIKQYPVFGVGISANQSLIPDELSGALGMVHSEILSAGYQMGFIGMGLYVAMLLILIVAGWKQYNENKNRARDASELGYVLFIAGIVIAVAGFFSPIPWSPMTMTLCGTASAMMANKV